MFPDLFTVSMEDALDQGIICIKVDFIGSDNVSSDGFHVAKVIKDIQSVVSQAKSFHVLKVQSEYICRFEFDHFRSPMFVVFEIGWIEVEGITRLR